MSTYNESNTLLYLEFLDMHEFTGEVIKLMDDQLSKFLYENSRDNFIMMYADHGFHMRGLVYMFDADDYDYELALPMLFMTKPPIEQKYRDMLKENEQRLVYAIDIHNFHKFLATGQVLKNETNLVGEIPKNRTCEDIDSDICQCF